MRVTSITAKLTVRDWYVLYGLAPDEALCGKIERILDKAVESGLITGTALQNVIASVRKTEPARHPEDFPGEYRPGGDSTCSGIAHPKKYHG